MWLGQFIVKVALVLLVLIGVAAAVGAATPPDQLAYDTRKSRSNYDLHLLDVRLRVDVPLTHTPHSERRPSWSPDGNQLAFTSDASGSWEIYTLSLTDLTAPPQQLTDDRARAMNPAWSPDGRSIAFDSSRDGNLELYLMPVPAADVFTLTDSNGDHSRRLTHIIGTDEGAVWSPEGDRLAFTSYRDNNLDIFLLDLDSGRSDNITQGVKRYNNWGPSWSPDGTTLTFASTRESIWQVYRLNPDAPGEVTQVTTLDQDVAGAVWSPEGDRLAVEVYDTRGARSLYTLPSDAHRATLNDLRRLTLGPTDDRYAAWRPR